MSFDFEKFFRGLSDSERRSLYSAVPFLTALVARADGKYSFKEKVARWKSFRQTRSELDAIFVSEQAIAEVAAHLETIGADLAAVATEEVTDRVKSELRRIGAVIRKMPPEMRAKYEDFLISACIGVAEASGRFLWLGETVSSAEIEVLRLIIRELKLPVDNRSVRKLLEIE